MNKKAETSGFVWIIIATVSILIGLALYSGTVQSDIGKMTKLYDATNVTMTLPANSVAAELTMCGQKANSIIVTNATGGAVVPTTNYSTSQSVGNDGYLAAKITPSGSTYASRSVNISCNYEQKGYIPEAGGRGIISLVAVFAVLLIIVAALPDLRNGVIDFVKG